jgi:hypothetical protein
MSTKRALVITTISPPNAVLHLCAKECAPRGIDFIVIGDRASPPDFHISDCDFWSLERQKNSGSRFAQTVPDRHYARKNVGYLIAMERGAESIIETDDDNFPYESFWLEKNRLQRTAVVDKGGWVNVYGYFADRLIWPRGFPLERVRDELPVMAGLERRDVDCPIQQGLADENPDVDAVYRLLFPQPVLFEKQVSIALGKNSCCPFNSQNTAWFKPAFPLLYLPSYCSFRMTDIWRSFVAQRICRENNWHVLFHSATVRQDRNQHDLLKDFSEEVPGYVANARIWTLLERVTLQPGIPHIADNLIRLYSCLVEQNFVDRNELTLLDLWLSEVA